MKNIDQLHYENELLRAELNAALITTKNLKAENKKLRIELEKLKQLKRMRMRLETRKNLYENTDQEIQFENRLLRSKKGLILKNLTSWKAILNILLELNYNLSHAKYISNIIFKMNERNLQAKISKFSDLLTKDERECINISTKNYKIFILDELIDIFIVEIHIKNTKNISFLNFINKNYYFLAYTEYLKDLNSPEFDISLIKNKTVKAAEKVGSIRTMIGGLPSLGKR